MKFQIVSDTHLEFHFQTPKFFEKFPKIMPSTWKKGGKKDNDEGDSTGEFLILAGDIGMLNLYGTTVLKDFFDKKEIQAFRKVFYVAGNHEYFYTEFNSTKKGLMKLCGAYDNIEMLDKSSFVLDLKKEKLKFEDQMKYKDYDSIRFVGCTLWSFMEEKDLKVKKFEDYLKNFEYLIKFKEGEKERKFSFLKDGVRIFKEETKYIENEISACTQHEKKTGKKQLLVVITHYPPLFHKELSPLKHRKSNELDKAFASDLSHIIDKMRKNDIWIYGHTHFSKKFEIGKNKIMVISNQVGYIPDYVSKDKDNASNFNNDFLLVL